MPPTPTPRRPLALLLGPLLGLTLIALSHTSPHPLGLTPSALAMAGITLWIALWWVTECLPIAATSLLPLLLLPATGILSSGDTAHAYMDRFIALMMAGFMAALAIERAQLHRRIALAVLLRVGTSPRRLVIGVLLATALLSMWIANTATALIMLPIVLALSSRLDPPSASTPSPVPLALLLAVAYGASIGGLATPLGTPPNLIYLGALAQHFGSTPSFFGWMLQMLPLTLLFLAATAFILVRPLSALPPEDPTTARTLLLREAEALGPLSPDERRVATVFLLMILLWVTRQLDLASGPWGWAPALHLERHVDDATVAVLGALLLFALPSKNRPGERLLDWATAKHIPWDVVLLFGGGLALAQGFSASGLSTAIAQSLAAFATLPPILFMLLIALVVTFLTEVTSNTALTTLLMPILAPVAIAHDLSPELVLLPAALCASCAFMLPVATPPNAIVYGSGRVPIRAMVRAGFALNLACALLITAWLALTST